MLSAGDHVPFILFVEVVGNAAKGSPEQIAGTAAKVGRIIGLTVIVIVVLDAHWPAAGVKVYVVVAVLFIAGDQVPFILFKEVVGKAANGSPEQIAATAVNVGTVGNAPSAIVIEEMY